MLNGKGNNKQTALLLADIHTLTDRRIGYTYVCVCVCHSYANGALHITRSAPTQRKSVLILETMQAEPQ